MVGGIRLKISRKILLTQAVPVSLLVITAVSLYVAISTMTPTVISLESEIAKLRKNSELREQVNSLGLIRNELQQNAIQYAKAQHSIIKTRYEFSLTKFKSTYDQALRLSDDKELFQNIWKIQQKLVAAELKLILNAKGSVGTSVESLFDDEYNVFSENFAFFVDQYYRKNKEEASDEFSRIIIINAILAKFRNFGELFAPIILVVIVLFSGIAIGIGILVSRSISRSIGKLSGAADDLSNGRVETEIDPTMLTRTDEIGDFARAFDAMKGSLLELSGRLIGALEEERSRIARELHDDFSQRLALLSVNLEGIRNQPPDSPENLSQCLESPLQHTKEISSDLHRLSHQLHPSALEQLGLVAAIKSYCEELSGQHEMHIELAHHEVPRRLPKDVALCLYRIVQEALRNVIKHSGAQTARVELSGTAEELALQISDTGTGFDSGSVQARRGLGLLSMRERLRLVGGKISVERLEPNGTRIEVRVPIPVSDDR